MTTLTLAIGLNPTHDYDPLTIYNKNDLAYLGGNQYICIQDGTVGILPAVGANWRLFAAGNLDTINASTYAPRSNARVKTLFTNHGQLGACSLMEGGTLMKRGYGANYNNGNGITATVAYTNVGLPYSFINETIKQVVGSQESNYLLTESGKVYSWGRNADGNLGLGNTTTIAVPTLITYFQTNGIAISQVIVSKGTDNIFFGNYENYINITVYFLSTTGKLYGCGYNGYGQLGIGNTTQQNTPVPIEPTKTFTKICATVNTYTSLYAIDNAGALWVAGYNGNGNLGLGNTTSITTLTQVTLSQQINDVAAAAGKQDNGGVNSFAVLKSVSGIIFTCGNNSYGQLGDGTTVSKSSFVSLQATLGTDNSSIFISNDGYYGVAGVIKNNGTVKIWGYNEQSALGQGNTTNSSSPLSLTFSNATSTVKAVICSGARQYQTFAFLFNDGKVYTTGYNGYYQRGDGVLGQSNFATEALLSKNIIDIASYGFAIYSGFVAKTNDGVEYTWGYSSSYYISGQILSYNSNIPSVVMY